MFAANDFCVWLSERNNGECLGVLEKDVKFGHSANVEWIWVKDAESV